MDKDEKKIEEQIEEKADDKAQETAPDPVDQENWQETLEYLQSEDYVEKKTETKAEETGASEAAHKKPRRRLPGKRIAALLLLVAVLFGGISAYLYFAPTTKRMEAEEYFAWMIGRQRGEGEVTLAEDEAAVVLQDQVASQVAIIHSGQIYLPYEMVRSNIFTRFYWDEPNSVMLYTTENDTWKIPLNSSTYTTKDGEGRYDSDIFYADARGMFINADFLAQYVNVETLDFAENKHVWVQYSWGKKQMAEVAQNSAVRFGSGNKELIVATVKKGNLVYVLGESRSWKRILTPDGYIGWIPAKRLGEVEEQEVTHAFTEQTYSSLTSEDKINLVWHRISSDEANKFLTSDTAGMTGVNVVSPTWFSLTDNEGGFSSYADKSYVNKAHKKGWQVWGLVDNFSTSMSTTTLMADSAARANLIANLIHAAKTVKMDGINIDFELIAEEAGYSYVQFMRELSVACRENELVLSVDIPVPQAYNTHYDRKELGVFCDYVIMMGYDEHYAGSEAGSVASLTFEENGITASLDYIPAKKLISAVPFYTRLWYTDVSGNVWSEAYGMDAIATTIDTYDAETVWDEETQQNYAAWTLQDGTTCQIWIEDEASLALKAKLVKTYDLGGIAAWALGFERSSVWSVIEENIGA